MESHHSILNYAVMYEYVKSVFRKNNNAFPGHNYILKNKLGIARKTVNFPLQLK